MSTDVIQGDKAILRFLAAVELIEEDLWEQYRELTVDVLTVEKDWYSQT